MKVTDWYARWIGSWLTIALGSLLAVAGVGTTVDNQYGLSGLAGAALLAVGGATLAVFGSRRRRKLLEERRQILERHRSRETKRDAGWLQVSCLGVAGVDGVNPGQRGWLRITSTGLEIQADGTDTPFPLPAADIAEITVSGPGEVRNGPTFVGGGFGWEGAIKGMLTAEALNALLGDRSVQTILSLVTKYGAEATWVTGDTLPEVLHQQLAPLRTDIRKRISANQDSLAKTSTEPGLADELAKLQQLRDSGTLDEAEFAAAKKRLLA